MRTRRLAPVLLLAALTGCAPRLQEPGPLATAPVGPRLDDAGLATADGLVLPVRRWLPAGAPRAVIVAVHGFNDYSNAFQAPAGISRGPVRPAARGCRRSTSGRRP